MSDSAIRILVYGMVTAGVTTFLSTVTTRASGVRRHVSKTFIETSWTHAGRELDLLLYGSRAQARWREPSLDGAPEGWPDLPDLRPETADGVLHLVDMREVFVTAGTVAITFESYLERRRSHNVDGELADPPIVHIGTKMDMEEIASPSVVERELGHELDAMLGLDEEGLYPFARVENAIDRLLQRIVVQRS